MITLIIIAVTALVSILCFSGTLNVNALMFNATKVWHGKQWYRMLSYGLVFPLICRPDFFNHFLAQLGL